MDVKLTLWHVENPPGGGEAPAQSAAQSTYDGAFVADRFTDDALP